VKANSEEVSTPKSADQRRLHKALLRYHDATNWPLLRKALRSMGRADLIGEKPHQLIPAEGHHHERRATEGRRFATQHTGLPRFPSKGKRSPKGRTPGGRG
jgi:hypothetical protein